MSTPMTTAGLIMCVPMLGLLTLAAAIDLRSRRIPNWLTFSLILAGFGQSFTWARTVAPADAMLGFLAGFGLTFVLFAIGALGGGDVKLMAALGCWMGPAPTLFIFAVAAIIGMMIVLAQAAAQGRLTKLFRNSAVIALSLAQAGDGGAVEQAAETGKVCSGEGKPLPYAVPVFFAVVITLFLV
jgi:prepilin peptidase CpaA